MTMTTPKNDCRGIQANKPLPPWEHPGCFRLDCKPHRGTLLVWMAAASVACSAVLLGPLVLPLTLTTWWLARRDLARMREGMTDPSGEQRTVCARYLCGVALLLTGLNTLVLLVILLDKGSK
jgi:hypothetical protein